MKMFKNESSNQRLLKSSLYTTLNETANGIPGNITSPKITSTPLQSIQKRRETLYATPPKPHLLSPKKYALSDIATPPRRGLRDTSRPQSPTGPLLASTRYNVSVSTYMDTKSPGLANRIVQYDEEQKQQRFLPTHQKKYDSPGLFPIVHLFKKKPPLLEQKPKTVTVRIASPDYSRHNSQEYNRMLMEGIVRPSPSRSGFSSPKNLSTSTRSVLDALKEISRKRIHATEDFDIHEEPGKRQRTDCFNGTDSNKRYRDETSKVDSPVSPSSTQKSKRVCVYDEYAASCSSSMLPLNKYPVTPKRKSAAISTTENLKEKTKQVKLINAETQTAESKEPEKPSEPDSNTEDQTTEKTEREMPVKIFDDGPLDRIRKNRLAALMGTLAGKSPVLAPKPTAKDQFTAGENADVPDNKPAEKPLIGILSTPKKSSPKSEKRVTFNLAANTSLAPPTITETTTSSSSLKLDLIVTQSSATSVSSTAGNESEKLTYTPASKPSLKDDSVTPTPPTSPVMFESPTEKNTPKFNSTITFSQSRNTSTALPSLGDASKTMSTPSPSLQNLFKNPQVGQSVESSSTVNNSATLENFFKMTNYGSSQPNLPATSAPTMPNISFGTPSTNVGKPGGFKFDLSPSKITESSASTTTTISNSSCANTTPQFTFTNQTNTDSNKPTFALGSTSNSNTNVAFGQTTQFNGGGFNFGKTTSSPGYGIATTTTTSISTGFVSPSFVSSNQNSEPKSSKSITGLGVNKPSFAFNANMSNIAPSTVVNSSTTIPVLGTSITSTPTFGVTATSTVPAFGANTSAPPSFGVNTSSVAPSFGVGNSATHSFGVDTTSTTGAFGVAATSGPASFGVSNSSGLSDFGVATTASTPSFGVTGTSGSTSFGNTTSKVPSFGTTNSALPFASGTSTFGTPKPPSAFGATSTTTASFGAGTPTFGNTAVASSGFGAVNTSSFGIPATTTTTCFGTSAIPSFGTSTTPSFGTSSTKTTASSGFGGNTNFGNKTFSFGATPVTTASPFGSPATTSPFGKPTPTPFGGTNSSSPFTATTVASPFGTSNNANTNTPSFGSTKQSFGTANSSNAFGTTTTTAAPMFGSTNTAAFGQNNNIFGSPSNASKPIFRGPNNNSGFNNNTPVTTAPFGSPNAFGAKTTASGFGGPTFGVTTTANSNLGTTTSTFGNSTASSFGNSTNTAFASNAPTSFGASNSFGSGNHTTGGFGSGNAGFGTSTTTAVTTGFGSKSVFESSAPTSNNVFGSPSAVNTFNPGFGASSAASAFSKPQANVNNFGTPASNNFGGNATNNTFGSGNTTFGNAAAPPPAVSTTQTSGVFNFGATSATKPPTGVFSFGGSSSNEIPKPNFSFTGGAAATNPPAFGAPVNNTPSFGAPGVPTFNAPPQAGSFSIGTWSTGSSSQRAKVKVKRRPV